MIGEGKQSQGEGDNTTRESLELLYDVSRELSSALDMNTVLRRVLLLSMQRVPQQRLHYRTR